MESNDFTYKEYDELKSLRVDKHSFALQLIGSNKEREVFTYKYIILDIFYDCEHCWKYALEAIIKWLLLYFFVHDNCLLFML